MVIVMIKENKSKSMSLEGFHWSRVILGLRKPAIALLGYALTQIASYPQFAWVGGLSAAAIWGTVEFYLREI